MSSLGAISTLKAKQSLLYFTKLSLSVPIQKPMCSEALAPQGGGGQEEILDKSGLTARIKERCGLGRRETAEVQVWEEFREFKCKVYVGSEALRIAGEWRDRANTMWMDGPRLESGEVEAVMAFWRNEEWVRRGTYLGKNKEVFDAEVFAILRAARLLNERGESGRNYTVSSDAQQRSRVQHDRCGPAQALARAVISTTDDLYDRGNTLSARWTPSHVGVEGNEQADRVAKRAAEGEDERAEPECL